MLDFISEAEERIQKALLADSFFQGVTVLRNANGDLVSKIDEALAGLGLFVIMRVSGGKAPLLGDVEDWNVEIIVTEQPLLNRGEGSSGKTARHAVQALIRVCRTTNVCDLTDVVEMVSESHVTWQLKGRVPVALSTGEI
jgi:hypothetical protein